MLILALDPSSTKTGWSVGRSDRELVEAGVFKPSAKARDALQRIHEMRRDLVALLREHRPEQIIIETPAAQAPARLSNPRGQATYGVAVGVMLDVCWLYRQQAGAHIEVHTIESDKWKRRVKKSHLQNCVALDFPQYDKRTDAGGDVSDAIGLMQWFYRQRMTRPEGVA